MSTVVLDEPQKTLFNVETKAINPYWIDPAQPLQIPVNPLHYEAHQLQLLLARLDRQATTNPAQFNSTNYINTLDRFTKLCQEINAKDHNAEILETPGLAESRDAGPAAAVGQGNAPRVDTGVSTDNPLAG